MKTTALALLAAAAVLHGAFAAQLQTYNVDLQYMTVSGLSAGAFMAVQYHTIHSSLGVLAGGPFFCAQADVEIALTSCMNPGGLSPPPDAEYLAALAKTAAAYNNIDSTYNLRYSKYWFLSGSKDTVVHSSVVKTLPDFYTALAVDEANIATQFSLPAEHCFPTNQTAYGEQCAQLGSPYIGQCNFDAALSMLQHFDDTPLSPPVQQVPGNLIEFDQSAFGTGHSLNSIGYIYVPTACASGVTKCRLHVSFHGCQQTTADVGAGYVTYTGLNEIAEANNIIVLYPQVSKSTLLPENPEGCFDWWGYTGPEYAYAAGAQPRFVDALVSKVAGVDF